jgi:hypothetical protein
MHAAFPQCIAGLLNVYLLPLLKDRFQSYTVDL